MRLEADIEHCQLYGERGQDQEGIDLYARTPRSDKYRVYQCKRVRKFGAAKIRAAVEAFLKAKSENNWAEKSDTLVLCTSEPMTATERANEIEQQAALLRARGIALIPWDSVQLSARLKVLPALVDDFFGREWVRAFCGDAAASQLGTRMDATRVAEFRRELGTFYKHVYNIHDPGLPSPTGAVHASALPVSARYITPDVYDDRLATAGAPVDLSQQSHAAVDVPPLPFADWTSYHEPRRPSRSSAARAAYRQRQSIERWLASEPRSIVLGIPGSGKSALLRFLAIDLLEESPRMGELALRWGTFLPVWLPFGYWTRLISNPLTSEYSVAEALRVWLRSWGEERLWPLVEQALGDKRLVLLVDGLDEWTDEAAARLALDRLRVFVEQRDVPAVLTSRPHGFERLGMQTAGWQVGELADLSADQQRRLAGVWFEHWLRPTLRASAHDEGEVARRADMDADAFLLQLRGAPDLQDLARVPLLLCLLMTLRFQGAGLPRSRFKAYQLMVEHLASAHPKRRRQTAGVTEDASQILADERRDMLAYLAYRIHREYGGGGINVSGATSVLEEYLTSDTGLGLPLRDARRIAREVTEVGEEVGGLLVKRSPTEISFFHRTFQEYLAAAHVSRLPLDEQLRLIREHCGGPQWREVLLVLAYLTTRPTDVDRIVSTMEEVRAHATSADHAAIDLLLCEIALGDFRCPPPLARRLSQHAFAVIERGHWMPQRQRLLALVLDARHSVRVGDQVRGKLQEWFPARTSTRTGLFRAMREWPATTEVLECLWKGLHDEDVGSQRAAGETLVVLAGRNPEVADQLESLVRETPEPSVQAAALELLVKNWPQRENLDSLLDPTRRSVSPELRLVSIISRIRKGVHTSEDREELLHLGTWEAGLDFDWRGEVSSALVEGWPGSPETKRACFEALREQRRDDSLLEPQVAYEVLVRGFPQDDEVALFIADHIRTDQHALFPYSPAWNLLREHFTDHPVLVEAVDERLPSDASFRQDVAMAALIGRTPVAKARLISLLDDRTPSVWRPLQWTVWALLEGWGMGDEEIAVKLLTMASGPTTTASRIGYFLPQILPDERESRARLLSLLRDPDCEAPDEVLAGLRRLDVQDGVAEVVDVVLETVLPRLGRDDSAHSGVVANLILGFSSDARVRDVAKRELHERDGDSWSVARAYGHDAEIRRDILRTANPLPAPLRNLIATRLGDTNEADEWSMSRLALYDHDPDAEVKTRASISYHALLLQSGRDTNEAAAKARVALASKGWDSRKRVPAAVCGLLTLRELDALKSLDGHATGELLWAISDELGIFPNPPLATHVLSHWDDMREVLGEHFWRNLPRIGSDPIDYWNLMSASADEYAGPREELLAFLESRTMRSAKSGVIRFLERVEPTSFLLLDYCLQTLRIGAGADCDPDEDSAVAAEVLGARFGGDEKVLATVMAGQGDYIYEKTILALCEGWPESDGLNSLFSRIREEHPRLHYTSYIRLLCSKAEAAKVYDVLLELLRRCESSASFRNWLRSPSMVVNPLMRRCREDDSFANMLMERLTQTPTPSEKATLPRILSASRGITVELKSWTVAELARQTDGSNVPETGIDLVESDRRPVGHSLLDVLTPSSTSSAFP